MLKTSRRERKKFTIKPDREPAATAMLASRRHRGWHPLRGPYQSDHFTIQPANLNLIKLEMTGQQTYELLDQQWSGVEGRGR
jgi:hypothetical protein